MTQPALLRAIFAEIVSEIQPKSVIMATILAALTASRRQTGIATEIQAAFLPATNAATANENSAKAVIIGISQGAFLAR